MAEAREERYDFLKRVGVVVVMVAIASFALGEVGTTTGHELGNDCGEVSMKDRPRLKRAKDWDSKDHLRAHDRYIHKRPDVFAGGYLVGKYFYVGFTRRVCYHLDRIRDMVEQRWRFRAFVAESSWRQLQRTRRCVWELSEQDWLGITAWGPNVWSNKSEVWLRDRSPRRERFIRQDCQQSRIRFQEGELEHD